MQQIDVHKVSDGARFNRFHAGVLFWCAIIIICDGYDLAVAGIALPSIMKEMGVTAQNAGIPVIAVPFGYTDVPVQNLGPNRVIQHFDELFGAIQAVMQKMAA